MIKCLNELLHTVQNMAVNNMISTLKMRIQKGLTILLLVCSVGVNATDVHRSDGHVYKNVQDLQQVDDIFVFTVNGRNYTLGSQRIDAIYDSKGKVIFEQMNLSVDKIVVPGSPTRFIFLKNGLRISEGKWIEGGIFSITKPLPHGVYKLFSDSGRLEREFSVTDNKLNGLNKVFYPSGHEKEVGTYKNNLESGITKSYYPTGELKGEATYKGGQKAGTTKLYYPSGNLQMEIMFKNKQPVGNQKMFYESGKLETEVAYLNGLKSGVVKSYYESGKVSMKGNYSSGKEHGEFITYYESGRVKKKKTFVMGRILKKR